MIKDRLISGKPLVICGEAGSGKSQAAYYAVKQSGLYQIEWIEASNFIWMQQHLQRTFHISMDRMRERNELENILASVPGTGAVAVIFDHVCDPELLKQIMRVSSSAQIIVTTSLSSFVCGEGYSYVQLKRWKPDGVLPLTRALKAAYAREIGETKGAHAQKCSETKPYVVALYQWLKDRERNAMNLEFGAWKLLQYGALMCGALISYTAMGKLMDLGPGEIRRNMCFLERLELIRQNGCEVSVCQTVQEAVRCCMGGEEVLDRVDRILVQVEEAFERIHLESWKIQEGREWRAHTEALLTDQSWRTDTEDAFCMEMHLCLLAGKYDFASGEYDSARQLLLKAKTGSWRRFPKLCREVMTELARLMETENDNDGVKAEIGEIRMEWPDLAKEQPELQADLLVIESQAEENRGFYERAKMLLEEGKILMEETNGITEEARREKMVYLLNGLGKIYCSRHRYHKAMRIFSDAISLCDSREEFRTAFLYGNKGYVLYRLGKYKEAEEYLTKQRQIYQSAYCDGPTCDELDNLNALIALYGRMNGKEDQIEECWKSAMRGIGEGGQRYRDARICLCNNYGAYQFRKNKLEEAIGSFDMGIRLCDQGKKQENRVILIQLLSNRAEALCRKKEFAMALEDLRRARSLGSRWKYRYLWLYTQYVRIYLKKAWHRGFIRSRRKFR